MNSALLEGFGGPAGRYARRSGPWFDPLPWSLLVATVLFVVCSLRQIPCVQTTEGVRVNAFIVLCYSDVPLAWSSSGFAFGAHPFDGGQMQYPPLLGLLLCVAIGISGLLGAPIGASLGVQAQLDGAQVFYAVCMVLLFACFLLWVLCQTFMGRDSRGGRYRSWDGMWLAASPVVLASGLVSWDLFAVSLTALGLLLFSTGRPVWSGIVLGLAVCAGLVAIAVVLAVTLAFALRGRAGRAGAFLGAAAAAVALLHLPLLILNWEAVAGYYQGEATKNLSYGSLFYLGKMFGWEVRAAGSLGLMLTALLLVIVAAWLYLRGHRPRVGTLVVLFVFPTALFGATYAPQTALWLLLALLVGRPSRPEWAAFTVTQVIYWAAIWGYLAGHLNSNPNIYFAAIILRIVVEVWIFISCLCDAADPGHDPLRTPQVADPIGGVLNEAAGPFARLRSTQPGNRAEMGQFPA